MSRPASLNVLTATDLADGDDHSFSLNIVGFNKPRPGQVWLITPVVGAGPLRTVDHYHLQIGEAEVSDEPGYEWVIDVEPHPVPTPRTWYEITSEVDRQGLVHLGIAVDDGTRISDPATIDIVCDLIGM